MSDGTVAVLCGGFSSEREVSLRSGQAIASALRQRGKQVELVDAGRDVALRLSQIHPEVAFIALHGKYGEDGCIQGLLEFMGIPYTGSGVLSSALAMHKVASKQRFLQAGIPTAPYISLSAQEVKAKGIASALARMDSEIGLPLVVKAACQGSTIGTYLVYQEGSLEEALRGALGYDSDILVEKLLQGMEVTVAILGNDPPLAMPIIEIISETGVYDYQAKYTAGLSRHVIPAPLNVEEAREVERHALAAYRALGCRGYARVDLIVDQKLGPQVLEVNTAPGMTELSLFPDAARAAGMEFPDLLEKILALALE